MLRAISSEIIESSARTGLPEKFVLIMVAELRSRLGPRRTGQAWLPKLTTSSILLPGIENDATSLIGLLTAKVFSRCTILKQFAVSASFMQVEQVPLLAETVPDIIRDETKCLRRHLGLGSLLKCLPGPLQLVLQFYLSNVLQILAMVRSASCPVALTGLGQMSTGLP